MDELIHHHEQQVAFHRNACEDATKTIDYHQFQAKRHLFFLRNLKRPLLIERDTPCIDSKPLKLSNQASPRVFGFPHWDQPADSPLDRVEPPPNTTCGGFSDAPLAVPQPLSFLPDNAVTIIPATNTALAVVLIGQEPPFNPTDYSLPFVCCSTRFSKHQGLASHLRDYHSDAWYCCSRCRRVFRNKSGACTHRTHCSLGSARNENS